MRAARSDRAAVEAREASAPRLIGDNIRHLLSAGVATIASVGFALTAGLDDRSPDEFLLGIVVLYFVAWTVYCASYCISTALVLGRVDGSTLWAWLTETGERRRRRRIGELITGGGGTTGAITLGVFALVAVAFAAGVPSLRTSPIVSVLATAVVVSTWLMIVTVYAVHYARETRNLGGLELIGEAGDARFAEYWFLALHVQTSLSMAAAHVTTGGMRRAVAAHSAVAYLFSTVVVALLVSLIAVPRP